MKATHMATLEAFLRSDELDATLRLARQLQIDEADKVVINETLEAWTDEQAIANLLMYPQFLPDALRHATLWRGLNQASDSYAVLAALVGWQDLELDEATRTLLVPRLLDILHSAPLITQARATVLLSDLVRPQDAEAILSLLSHSDELIRHNGLVALISAAELHKVVAVLQAAFQRGALSPEAKAYADAKLAGWERFFKQGELDYSQWYLSDLSAPLLAYIPNLKDFAP